MRIYCHFIITSLNLQNQYILTENSTTDDKNINLQINTTSTKSTNAISFKFTTNPTSRTADTANIYITKSKKACKYSRSRGVCFYGMLVTSRHLFNLSRIFNNKWMLKYCDGIRAAFR